MSWSFETDSEFQEQLNWIDKFTREEIEPLDLVFRGPGDPWDPDSPAAALIEFAASTKRGLCADKGRPSQDDSVSD